VQLCIVYLNYEPSRWCQLEAREQKLGNGRGLWPDFKEKEPTIIFEGVKKESPEFHILLRIDILRARSYMAWQWKRGGSDLNHYTTYPIDSDHTFVESEHKKKEENPCEISFATRTIWGLIYN
jgi:hypothetical protein